MESLPQSQPSLAIRIESVLLVAPDAVSLERLAELTSVAPGEVRTALDELQRRLATSGMRLVVDGGRAQLVTTPETAEVVERYLGLDEPGRLSPAALETLAIVAYRQPVTRAQVEAIRGVNSDRALSTLEARGLIAEVGRLEVAGRPAIFGTTPEFLQAFGLTTLDELPRLTPSTEN